MSRDTNLAKTELGTQCREEGHRNDTDDVEEKDTQDTIGEASIEQRRSKDTNGERRNDHVC